MVVFQNTQCHVAQQRGLAGAGRRYDETASTLADGAKKIDGAGREAPILHLHLQMLIWGDRGERGEIKASPAILKGDAIDGLPGEGDEEV